MIFNELQSRARWRAVFPAAAVVVVCLAGCNRAASPTAEPKTLRIGTQSALETLGVLTYLLYTDPLITIDSHGKPSLRLATD